MNEPWTGKLEGTATVSLGLANLGNTCYLNSVLQALSHCPSICAYFGHSSTPHEYYIANENRNEFCKNFSNMITKVWMDGISDRDNRHFMPRAAVKNIIQAVPEFRENGQQDAQEALNYILNYLHDELAILTPPENHPARLILEKLDLDQKEMNSIKFVPPITETKKKKKKMFRIRTKSRENSKESLLAVKVNSMDSIDDEEDDDSFVQLHNDYLQSIISDTFQTLLVQRITCKSCGYTSLSLEELYDISLALPSKSHVKEMKKKLHEESSDNEDTSFWKGMAKSLASTLGLESHSLTLMQCLHGFFMPEQLEGEEQYVCDKCNCKRDAEKSHSFAHLPEILCLNFKRFNRTGISWALNSLKNPTPVSYPLYDLDLSDFMYDKSIAAPTYHLNAVVKHAGSIHGGHYYAYCKNPNSGIWYEYDDDVCRQVDESTVTTTDAYLLFYKKSITETQLQKREAFQNVVQDIDTKNFECFLSDYWTIKLNTLCEPNMVTSFDICCPHGLVLPKMINTKQLYGVSRELWNELSKQYGAMAPLTEARECDECLAMANEVQTRREFEQSEVHRIRMEDTVKQDHYLIHEGWIRNWKRFVQNCHHPTGRGTFMGTPPPGEISNHSLVDEKGPKPNKKLGRDYRAVSKEIWDLFLEIYGGGPLLYRETQDLYNV